VKTLLVIDDDPGWRSLYRILFEGRFDVFEAADGVEGLKRYTEVLPDLVIVDLCMPRMDGAMFLEKVRGIPHQARVVVCTALGPEAAPQAPPGVRFVSKSPDLKELVSGVASFQPVPQAP
jgi:two-component system response regulator EvgA